MIIIGLTGSIGMGKTTTAAMFADAGVPVHDADATVHALYKHQETIEKIETAFPGSTDENGVSRVKLGQLVYDNKHAMEKLESIVHPLVQEAERKFIEQHHNAPIVVLDIPLLFETGAHKRVDKIVVVTAPAEVQRARVMARDGMTKERFESILLRQTPDTEKRARADYIVDTSKGMEQARSQVAKIIDKVTNAG